MHGLEAEYWGRVDFIYIDRDDPANVDVLDRYQFSYQPLFVLVDAQGTELQRWFGAVPADVLREALNSVIT